MDFFFILEQRATFLYVRAYFSSVDVRAGSRHGDDRGDPRAGGSRAEGVQLQYLHQALPVLRPWGECDDSEAAPVVSGARGVALSCFRLHLDTRWAPGFTFLPVARSKTHLHFSKLLFVMFCFKKSIKKPSSHLYY